MKKSFVFVVMVALLATLLVGCNTVGTTQYNKEIIKPAEEGGVFNYDDLEELQSNWNLTSGGTASSVFSIVDNGESHDNYLQISTSSAGYATASQTLYLRTNSYYKVSYEYTTSSMATFDEEKPYIGLYVGFTENTDFNISSSKATEERASNSKGKASYYFKTNNIREVNLAINVGTKDNPIKCNKVVIKNISLTRVEKATALAGSTGEDLYQLKSTLYGRPSVLNVTYIVIGAVATILVAYAFYMLKARSNALQEINSQNKFFVKLQSSKWLGMLIVLGGAAFVRLLIMLTETLIAGSHNISTIFYGFDLDNLSKFGTWIASYGTPYFFEYNPTATLMPMNLYFAGAAGLIGQLIGSIPGATDITIKLTVVAMLKIFAIAADLGVIAIIYKLISKRQGNVSATIMAGFYAIIPIIFSMSAAWGAMESIATFFVVLAFYGILNKNYILMACAYFVATMTSVSALVFVPFILLYTGMLIYKSIKDKNKEWIKPLCCIVGGLVLFFIIALPFNFFAVQKGDAFASFKSFITAVAGANVYSLNAFNFQAMIGNNFKTITTESMFVTILFILLIVGLFAVPYIKNKNRLSLVMLSAGGMMIYWMFCNGAMQYTLLAALPLLFIYTALVQDKRLYAVFSVYSAFTFINCAYVYMVAGYTADGITHMDYSNPVMYIMGALNLILVIAFVIVAYDSVVSKKTSSYLVLRVPYVQYVRSVAKNVGIFGVNLGNQTKTFFAQINEAIKQDRKERKERKINKSEEDKKED